MYVRQAFFFGGGAGMSKMWKNSTRIVLNKGNLTNFASKHFKNICNAVDELNEFYQRRLVVLLMYVQNWSNNYDSQAIGPILCKILVCVSNKVVFWMNQKLLD